jgi:uncharacterized protein YjhX (UPF0386 family)
MKAYLHIRSHTGGVVTVDRDTDGIVAAVNCLFRKGK